MALYTKKEFADICGVKTNYLSVPIKRGQIILTGDLIESNDAKNLAFYKKREKPNHQPEQIIPSLNEIETASPPKEIKLPPPSSKNNGSQNIYNLDIELKQADLLKKEVDTRLALLKEEKLMGISIPTELVKNVIANLSKSMISSFKDGADNFIIEISKRKSLTGTETAELRGVLVNIINTSSTHAILESKKSLKNIVSEFSDKKEVGEHE